jgi:PAS domain-containing protein
MDCNANPSSKTHSTGASPDGQPVQHQLQASSNELPVLAPNNTNQSVSYSTSPYDSLHAHAFQLSASAGLVSSYSQPQNSQATVMIAAPHAQQMSQPMQHQQQGTQQSQNSQPTLMIAAPHAQQMPQHMQQHQQQQGTQQSQYISQAQAPMLISNPVYTQQTIVAAPGVMQGTMQPQHYYVTGAPIQMTQQQGLPQYTATYFHQWQPNLPEPAQVTYTTDPSTVKRLAPESVEQDPAKRQNIVSQPIYAPTPVNMPPVVAQTPMVYTAPVMTIPQAPDTLMSAYDMLDDDEDINPANKPQPDFSTMTADERRRYERNVREQQRSYKISQQIKVLKIVLTESGVPYKPNKFSILMSVADYIKQLQSRAIMLDAEHQKLAATIRETSEMVNAGQVPSEGKEKTSQFGASDSEMLFVQGLDYKAVFDQCTAGLGVAALDGRILACNPEFESLAGVSKDVLLRQSLFALMQNHKDVFEAMGSMLKEPVPQPCLDKNGESTSDGKPEYWSGTVLQRDQSTVSA